MKDLKKLTDEQRKTVALAAKIAAQTPLTEFMDAVESRLNEYDKRDDKLVTPRKLKHN